MPSITGTTRVFYILGDPVASIVKAYCLGPSTRRRPSPTA